MNLSFSFALNVGSQPSQFEQISCTAASVLVLLFVLVGNSLVVLSIFTYQPLQQVQNALIVSLATSDLAVGLFVLPLKIGTHVADGRWIFGFYLCTFYVTSDVFFCTASILNLCAVALDRYWAIRYPIRYARHRTLFNLSGMISLVYLLSALIVLPPIFGWAPPTYEHIDAIYSCEMNRQPSYVIFSAFGSFFIPAILILFVYVQLFRLTRQRLRIQLPHLSSIFNKRRQVISKYAFASMSSTMLKTKVWKDLADQSSNSAIATDRTDLHTVAKQRRQLSAYRERRVTRTLIIIIGSFFLCWLPFFVAYVSDPFCHGPCVKNEKARDLIVWLTYLNSAVNPIIYTTSNADFKRGFQRLLCCSK
ncbi:5-hydroxytryptamine receptor 1 [Paragonimus westermani]|uniref:5-hydroxytryptamine receptor 1 n=1 Tax=Paragonimus westermani TaxID=34504 RepID=A0A5J4NB49_9TREM|nr:5-hydroxytryptamine receptor 1 [Paragonimus westermani]